MTSSASSFRRQISPGVGETPWDQAQPAANLCGLETERAAIGAAIDVRIALVFRPIEIDPGACATLNEHRFRGAGRERERIDVSVFQRPERFHGNA